MHPTSPSDDSVVATDVVQASETPLPSRLRLVVTDGPDRGRELALGRGAYVVGKSVGCDLVLSDPTVSRRHIEVVVQDRRLLCSDLGSTNGSFFQGARFRAIDLRVGAAVAIGATTLRVERPGARPIVPASDATSFGGLAGRSALMREVFVRCERAAASDVPVLITGETGTGKEVCANAIHAASRRRNGPFVVCDLAGVSRSLIESELFGHVRGAFTGASADRPGAFVQAAGGTIFVDELGELEPDLQPRLLRALDRRQVKPLGASAYASVDVRLIAATQRVLEQDVAAGRFRRDLFYRIAVLKIALPPLRDRKGDIPLLVDRFVREFQPARSIEILRETLSLLGEYDWPGNVRELRNTVERALALAPDAARLEPYMLGIDLPGLGEASAADRELGFREAKERLVSGWEREYVAGLLRRAGGNVSEAARRAGMGRVHLYRLLKKHGLGQ